MKGVSVVMDIRGVCMSWGQRRKVHSFRLPVCPLVLDTWLPRVTPWQMVSKTPQMSSAELKHPYDTLNSSASLWDILTKRGFPGIGHIGPRYFTHTRNLSLAFQHPEVIDQQLAKEVDAGRILGPFTTPPIYPLHCLCLSAIPKKNSKW